MWLSDQQKVGVTIVAAGALSLLTGVVMFFDSRLMSFGSLLLTAGLVFLLSPRRFVAYFTAKRKRKGSLCYLFGVVLVLRRWRVLGFAVELFGILNLFADFSGVIVAFLRQLPVIGDILNHPRVSAFVDRTSTGQLLPV